MKEIEIKAKIDDLKNIEKKLEKLGCKFVEEVRQNDTVFMEKGMKFGDRDNNTIFLRLRDENGKYFFTLKHHHENEAILTEKEVVVSSLDELSDILKLLGFYQVMKISKIRKKYKFEKYEICLDKVDGLGSFMEIEKMTDEKDGLKVQEELFQFFSKLGVGREDVIKNGYGTLIYEKELTVK